MNSTTVVRAHDPDPLSSASGPTAEELERDKVWKKPDQVFGPGLGILQRYMRMLSQLATEQQERMKKHGNEANEAQNIVAKLDAHMGTLEKPNDKATLKDNDPILKFIGQHLELDSNGFFKYHDNDKKRTHSRETLTAVRGNVQKYATQHSDATSQIQLQVQKSMQTYNVTIGLVNSLQTMLGDMTKQFAQAIR